MTIKLRKLKRNEKKGKKKMIFYLLANARITKFTAAFNTKIVSFWIKLSSEKGDRMYRFFIGLVDFSPIEAENSMKNGSATDPNVNIYMYFLTGWYR